MTLIEVLTASTLGVLCVFGAVSTLLMGMTGWAKGQGSISSNLDSQKSIRLVTSELKEAMEVTIDADGLGLTYKLPAADGTGLYSQPMTWDGVSRRMQYVVSGSVGRIEMGPTTNLRVIATNVSNTNPGTGNTMRVFVPGDGAVVREITVRLTADNYGSSYSREKTLALETVFLRNIPVTTR